MGVLADDIGPQHLVQLELPLGLEAGQEPAVDHRRRPAGDDVVLVAGVEHRRVGGVAQRGADDAGQRPEQRDGGLHVVRVELDAERVADLVEEGPHRLGDVHRKLVPPQPRDRLAQLRDGVVVVDHRAVTGRAGRRQAHPGHALLRRLDHVEPHIVGDAQAEAADLADGLGAPLEQVRLLLDQVTGAPDAASLLVGEEREDDVARRLAPGAHPLADDGQHHRVHVLHVDGATSPDATLGHLGGERVVGPLLGLGGHDVEVAVHEQPGAAGVRPLDPGHDAGAAG